MPDSDDERLSRLLDGELEAAEAAEIRQDPEHAGRAAALRDQDQAIADWFGGHLPDPPEALERSVRTAFAVRRSARSRTPAHRWWLPAAAAIAIVAMGAAGFDYMIERRVGHALDQMRTERASDMAFLSSAMQEVLETHQSGQEVQYRNSDTGFAVTLIARRTWKSDSGHWCREFVEIFDGAGLADAPVSTACRSGEGQWVRIRTELLSPAAPFLPDPPQQHKL